MALRALQSLRDSLFVAPGRDAEMALLWREALVTACYARVLAQEGGLDAPLLTGVGLLHRAGEIAALRALAQAERETQQRLAGSIVQDIFDAGDDELASPRDAQLGSFRRTAPGHHPLARRAGEPATTGMRHAPDAGAGVDHGARAFGDLRAGLAETAREALKLPASMMERARTATAEIAALLATLESRPA